MRFLLRLIPSFRLLEAELELLAARRFELEDLNRVLAEEIEWLRGQQRQLIDARDASKDHSREDLQKMLDFVAEERFGRPVFSKESAVAPPEAAEPEKPAPLRGIVGFDDFAEDVERYVSQPNGSGSAN